MFWELYEVWARHEDGYEELIVTTKDLKEAKEEAQATLQEDSIDECVIYREDQEGDLVEISRLHKG